MYVTTDAVAFCVPPGEELQLLLVERANPPFQGLWALPGGFVDEDEDLQTACVREMQEETGVRPSVLLQLGAWGKPGRDPRGRNVSVAYIAAVRFGEAEVEAGSDAAQARWHPMSNLPELAFDHRQIVTAAFRRLRSLANGTHFVYWLLPERFTLEQLRDTLTSVIGELVTAQEALAFARRGRLIKEPAELPREKEMYRAAAADPLAPLR
jgi:8-oxo-dGTP diphosphatase